MARGNYTLSWKKGNQGLNYTITLGQNSAFSFYWEFRGKTIAEVFKSGKQWLANIYVPKERSIQYTCDTQAEAKDRVVKYFASEKMYLDAMVVSAK
jgi:hypothetical protein